MTPATLSIYQGNDYAAVVTVWNDAGPVNLAGFTAKSQIRAGPADTNPDVIVEISTAISLPNTINLVIPNSITRTLAGAYVWDLLVTDPVGIKSTLMAGNVTVIREVTRYP